MDHAVEKSTYLDGRVRVVVGDITRLDVDAIVNAANGTLFGGGGVDGAIHRAGGPEILSACRELRREKLPDGLPTGEAVATTAGQLAAEMIVHTVGPVYGYHGGHESELLASCYARSLEIVAEAGLRSVAFPAVSTGVYGYPAAEAARIVSRAVEAFLAQHEQPEAVQLVFFSEEGAEVFIANQEFTT